MPSSSDDLNYTIAFRKIKGEETWDTLAILQKIESIYVDTAVQQNIMYEYSLIAVDSAGLSSPMSFTVTARPYYTGILPVILNLNATYDSLSHKVSLTWTYEKMSEPCYFMIYRSYNEEGLTQFSRQNEPSNYSFVDTEMDRGKGKYEYGIKVFNDIGGESKISKKAAVLVK